MIARAPLAALALALGCAAPDAEPVRHVLLISIDTLRADHLGSYGYDRPTSPNLDAFAAESVLFEQAWTTAPWTLPAHASLLTGLYPSHHGARARRQRAEPEIATIAGALREAGFATGAVVNVSLLARRYGFLEGFDTIQRVPANDDRRGAAPAISLLGLEWLDDQDGPTFLFLHYFDVHTDYGAPPEIERLFTAEPPGLRGTTEEVMGFRARGTARPDEIDRLRALYDAGIRQLDEELGRLFAALQERGRWEQTLVLVTSDHGEEFFEHGSVSHGHTHHEELLRVPLLVRHPRGPRGVRVSDPVSLVDGMPTILGAAGVPLGAGLDGLDLAPAWSGGLGARADRPVFAEALGPHQPQGLRSARRGDFKLILDSDQNRSRLFDLAADPGELRDLRGEHPEVVAMLEADLAALAASAVPERNAVVLTPEDLERLEALGYGGP